MTFTFHGLSIRLVSASPQDLNYFITSSWASRLGSRIHLGKYDRGHCSPPVHAPGSSEPHHESCVSLGASRDLFGPQLPHLQNGTISRTELLVLGGVWNETLACPAHS